MSRSRIRQSIMSKYARGAFTLIELLVVVAIIALLLAILIPSLTEARDQARSARCLANMQDMGKGVHTFSNAHRDRFQVIYNIAAVTAANDLAQIGDTSRNIFAYES